MRKAGWFNPYHIEANHKKKKNNQTPGKSKTLQCQATPLKKALCKARAYKTHPQYDRWEEIFAQRGRAKA